MANKKPVSELKKAYYEWLKGKLASNPMGQQGGVNPLIERLKQAAAGYKPLGKK